MVPNTWYKPGDLVRDRLDTASVSRTLHQLIELGLVERELAEGRQRRYQYRLTMRGTKWWAPGQAPRNSLRPPRLEERLADWQRLGREVGRWLREWLREFIP